jgi:hypothetical protein
MTDKPKRKRGPKPDPASKRDKRVSVYFSYLEYEKLIGIVGDKKFASDHMRRLALRSRSHRVIIPELNRQAYSELSRAAANLNQVARSINSGDHLSIEHIEETLRAFRMALIGAGAE